MSNVATKCCRKKVVADALVTSRCSRCSRCSPSSWCSRCCPPRLAERRLRFLLRFQLRPVPNRSQTSRHSAKNEKQCLIEIARLRISRCYLTRSLCRRRLTTRHYRAVHVSILTNACHCTPDVIYKARVYGNPSPSLSPSRARARGRISRV